MQKTIRRCDYPGCVSLEEAVMHELKYSGRAYEIDLCLDHQSRVLGLPWRLAEPQTPRERAARERELRRLDGFVRMPPGTPRIDGTR